MADRRNRTRQSYRTPGVVDGNLARRLDGQELERRLERSGQLDFDQQYRRRRETEAERISRRRAKAKARVRPAQKVNGAAGYQIAYSVKKNFTAAKTKEAKASAKSKTITGLKDGKKYYVRVRAYSLDSAENRVYGPYSAVKSILVKN